MADWKKQLAWLAAGDPRDPYPYDVLDCRPACEALASVTTNETMSDAVAKIAEIAGASHAESITTKILTTSCLIRLSGFDPDTGKIKLIRPGIGHKWNLEIVEQRFVARRNWTGQIIHAADFKIEDHEIIVYQIISDANAVFESTAFAMSEFEFLLRTYMEGQSCAFPIPPELGRSDVEKIALHGWKAYGPIATFARSLS